MRQTSVYVIAEAGVNHNGSLDLAMELIEVAARAGADAVKFQTFKAESLVSVHAAKAEYQQRTTGNQGSQLQMLKKLELSVNDHKQLIEACKKHQIEFLSTPFDIHSLELLIDTFEMKSLKISSGDVTNLPLLVRAGRTNADIIVSSGISTLGEIEDALGAIAFGCLDPKGTPSIEAIRDAYYSDEGQRRLQERVSLLHCTTNYPTMYQDVHLNKMMTMKQAFGLRFGYSDHTLGAEVSIAAVAMGATIIEKHFTLDKGMEGPDHLASMDPDELCQMIVQIRNVEASLGTSLKVPAPSERKNAAPARKSVVASADIKEGELFTERNLTVKRPGTGRPPADLWRLLGLRAMRNYSADDLID
jgi:N-acetylneuraminate synthase